MDNKSIIFEVWPFVLQIPTTSPYHVIKLRHKFSTMSFTETDYLPLRILIAFVYSFLPETGRYLHENK